MKTRIGRTFSRSAVMSARHFVRSGLSTKREIPASQIPKLWQQAQAVCFDVDCTITKQDALDDLAEFLGKGDEVRKLTNAAMDGDMSLDEALQKRLEIMEPTADKLRGYMQSNPAEQRLVPGIKTLIQELLARKVEVFLISGGFRELILPVADALGIPRDNIFANRFVYMADDMLKDDGFPEIRVRTFDRDEPTSHAGGKPEAIRRIRKMKPLKTIVMVGDGITDLEAVQETGGADLFVGYGGVVERTKVKDHADLWVTDYSELIRMLPRLKVAMVGSGAFASATMQMISHNAQAKALFHDRVSMYVHEEEFNGGKLTDSINDLHENPKYLPGVRYGDNVVANSDLQDTVRDADLIVFCAPHQFMHQICKQIQLVTKPTAFAISLTKGIHISPEGPQLMSAMVRRMLNIECSVLMGANLADEIGPKGLTEATIGCHFFEQGEVFRELFDTPYFSVEVINDVEGAELAGALKNIVALAAGFADGCELGQNTKAVVMRQGLNEMRAFAKASFGTVRDDTFFESCGVPDLIVTCYRGRNYRVASRFAELQGTRTFDDLELEMLGGQKLQGVLSSFEVQTVLKRKDWEEKYPLFTAVNAILRGLFEPKDIARFRYIAASPELQKPDENGISLLEEKIGL